MIDLALGNDAARPLKRFKSSKQKAEMGGESVALKRGFYWEGRHPSVLTMRQIFSMISALQRRIRNSYPKIASLPNKCLTTDAFRSPSLVIMLIRCSSGGITTRSFHSHLDLLAWYFLFRFRLLRQMLSEWFPELESRWLKAEVPCSFVLLLTWIRREASEPWRPLCPLVCCDKSSRVLQALSDSRHCFGATVHYPVTSAKDSDDGFEDDDEEDEEDD